MADPQFIIDIPFTIKISVVATLIRIRRNVVANLTEKIFVAPVENTNTMEWRILLPNPRR
jgi:hypothetical protein